MMLMCRPSTKAQQQYNAASVTGNVYPPLPTFTGNVAYILCIVSKWIGTSTS